MKKKTMGGYLHNFKFPQLSVSSISGVIPWSEKNQVQLNLVVSPVQIFDWRK